MKILWIFGYPESSGYARNSREFIKAFNANDIETKFLINSYDEEYPDKQEISKFAITRKDAKDFNFDVVVQNVVPHSFRRVAGKKNILMTVAETDTVSKKWIDYCNTADELWTMSYFSASAFVTSGLKIPFKITLMPVDTDKIHAAQGTYKLLEKYEDKFIFFANSEWTPRKGWDILLDAYFHEFRKDKKVALLIKTCCFSNCETTASMYNEARIYKEKYKAKCSAVIFNQIWPIEKVWSMYFLSNAYVLASRGEGCGIGYLESMACGRPVIAPAKGGQADYFLPGLSNPVSCKIEPAYKFPHNPNYDEYMKWIETDKDDLRFKMRNVRHFYNNKLALQNPDSINEGLFKAMYGLQGAEMQKLCKELKEQY